MKVVRSIEDGSAVVVEAIYGCMECAVLRSQQIPT
jgi:hypothetical protein